ncbi:MAG: S8 family serine peptidase [Phycisphaerales bacterium]|nr:S8 family serine peptidase [Phycisphaerales bacterium]
MIFNHLACAATIGLMSASLSAMPWEVVPTDYTRMVDGQEVPLSMDVSRIACFQSGIVSPTTAGRSLTSHGLNKDTIVPSGSDGWMYAEFIDGQTVESVAESVRRIARSGDVDFASPVFLSGTQSLPWIVTRDIIVSVDPALAIGARADLLASIPGGVIEEQLGGMDGVMLIETDLTNAFEVLKLVKSLESRPEIRFAQTDAIWWAMPQGNVPNDPLWPQMWGHEQASDQDMDALGAWAVTTGAPDILVAVFDDGLDQDHPDMNQMPGYNFTGSGNDGDHEDECDGHGTCVASCVSSRLDNGIGTVGIAPSCRTVGMKIFNSVSFFGFCLGFLESQDSWTVAGLNQAVAINAKVTNSSWGGGAASTVVNAAFDSSRAAGVLHVAAAGNDGTTTISWPASHGSLLAVSALSSSGNLASFSTSGIGLFCSAPGEGIWCADAVGADGFGTGDTTQIDGTSFASPYVAGVAALVFSMDPALSPDQVEAILSETAVDRGAAGYDTQYGWGFVNAKAAVEAVDVETPCDGDIDGNNSVDVNDILSLIGAFGPCQGCDEDLDQNGSVDVNDLLSMISNYGPCD